MTRQDLTKLVLSCSVPRGYCYTSGVFWSHGVELAKLLWLQKSSYSKGIYVNVGCCGKNDFTNGIPPQIEYWGLHTQASLTDSDFAEQFRFLAIDDEGEMSAEHMRSPINQLLDWMDTNFDNGVEVARAIIKTGSWNGMLATSTGLNWANSLLRLQ